MLIESVTLKKALIEALHENRATALHTKHQIGLAFLNAYIGALEKVVLFIDQAEKKGVIDMDKLKNEMSAKVVTVGELAPRRVMKETEEKLVRYATELMTLMDKWEANPRHTAESRPALEINGLTWGHFSNKSHNLRKDGKIDPRIGPMKRGKQMFLVRHDEPIQGRPRIKAHTDIDRMIKQTAQSHRIIK